MFHHKTLKRNTLAIVAILALVSVNIVGPIFAGGKQVRAQIDSANLLELHNRERQKNNLPILRLNAELNASAATKAEAMLASNCWSHYCPDGKEPWDFFKNAGYAYVTAGENLAEGFATNAGVMTAWINSPSHLANIMNGKFTEVGFGFARGKYQGQDNNLIVVVHFGTPLISKFINANANSDVMAPELLAPQNNSHLNNPNLEVYGKTQAGSSVELQLNGKTTIVDANQGIFTYRYTNLPDNYYSLAATAIANNQRSLMSNSVEFTLDTVPDPITRNEISLQSVINELVINIAKPQVGEISVVVPQGEYKFNKVSDDLWQARVPSQAGSNELVFSNKDLAGNVSGVAYTVNDLPQDNWNILQIVGNPWQIINIVGIIVLAAVVLLDFRWWLKEHNDDKDSHAHHHYHLGVLTVLLIVVIISGFNGHILTGVSL